jgi:HEPN domain-containing protein
VERLVRDNGLEHLTGAAADGAPLLEAARKTVATAAGLVEADARSAYVLAYDAARLACSALLTQQGMRATSQGGHYAVERAVRAQFGSGFRPFADLRRRRNELEYPRIPADATTADEAEQAVETANRLISAADSLLGQLSFFAQPEIREP